MITIWHPGQPQGKGRPRHSRNGHTYTPGKTRDYEKGLAAVAKAECPEPYPPHELAGLIILARFSIPPSWSRKKREQARLGLLRPRGPVDIDNVTKIVCDALNGIIWADDAQVVTCTADKIYSENPGVLVRVYRWPEETRDRVLGLSAQALDLLEDKIHVEGPGRPARARRVGGSHG